MQIETAILVGGMFAIATYLILNRNFVHILFGFIILSNAANLFIVSMSGAPDGKGSPILEEHAVPLVDPLPQSLVLTAIVIGFGLTIYLIMLLYRIFLDARTIDADALFKRGPDDE